MWVIVFLLGIGVSGCASTSTTQLHGKQVSHHPADDF
jgi:hypothetical protein